MKLEMVTIIACEVDTEVFTSDKMQVRFLHPKCTSQRIVTLAPLRCGCAAVCWGRTACCPVELHACLWWRWMQLSFSPSLSVRRGFLSMGATARQGARPAPRARHSDWRWMNCRNGYTRQEWDTHTDTHAKRDPKCANRSYRCVSYRAWGFGWWCASWLGGCDELSMQGTCRQRSEAVLDAVADRPPSPSLYLCSLLILAALQVYCVRWDTKKGALTTREYIRGILCRCHINANMLYHK